MSADYIAQIKISGHPTQVAGSISFTNGTTTELNSTDIMSPNYVKLSIGTSRPNTFDVGIAAMKTISMSLNNFNGKYDNFDFTDAVIYLSVGLTLDSGEVEFMDCGAYTVDKPVVKGKVINVTGIDAMYKTERPYSDSTLVYPATLHDIVLDISTVCGIYWDEASFLNDTMSVAVRPSSSSLTCRDVLGMVAQLACSNVRISRSYDSFEFHWYNLQENIYEVSSVFSKNIAANNFIISGIEYSPEDSSLGITLYGSDSNSVLVVEGNLLLDALNYNDALTNLYNALAGFSFRPFTCKSFSDFSVDAGDTIYLVEDNITTIITNVTHIIMGGSQYSGDAETPLVNKTGVYSPISKMKAIAASQAEIKMTAYEEMTMEATSVLATSKGFYETKIYGSNGQILEYYQHDQPTLADSIRVTKITIDGIGFSMDGGATYTTALMGNGNASIPQLASRLIMADLITAGKIQSLDGSTYFDLTGAEIKQTISINGIPYYIIMSADEGFAIYRNTEKIFGVDTLSGDLITRSDISADDITAGSLRNFNGHIVLDLDLETLTFLDHYWSFSTGCFTFESSQGTADYDYEFKKSGGVAPVIVNVSGRLRVRDAVQWGDFIRVESRDDVGNEGIDFVFITPPEA
jgi:hypothetical protein